MDANKSIEITPEMIRAGLVVLSEYDCYGMDKDEAIREILRAALSARQLSPELELGTQQAASRLVGS